MATVRLITGSLHIQAVVMCYTYLLLVTSYLAYPQHLTTAYFYRYKTKMTQKEFLDGTEDYNDKQQKLWQEVNEKIKFWKFLNNDRHKITFSNWHLSKKEVPGYKDKTVMGEKIEFKSTVEIGADKYMFSTLSVMFISAVEPYLFKLNPLSDKVTLNIKRIGEGKNVQYDVEVEE